MEAINISFLINNGRISANPLFLGLGAMELSKYEHDENLNKKLVPQEIFKEAVELAILKKDASALSSLEALYKNTSFQENDYAVKMKENIALLASTRGQVTDDDVADAIGKGLAVAILSILSVMLQ